MLPTSDILEAFHSSLKNLDGILAKLGSAEVKRAETVQKISALAKEWLQLSGALRYSDAISADVLDGIDMQMLEVQRSTGLRTRASAYRKKLASVSDHFVENIIAPVIKLEASPAQVAGRDLINILYNQITPAEKGYIDEAMRCLTLKCHRAAMIMLWAATMARLHCVIEQMGFATFNAALDATVTKKVAPFKYVAKGSPISSLPELQRMKDYDIIVIGMELWKYDLQTFEELDRLLGTRNGAAHPGMLNPTALDVLQFARKLNDYVFAKI